MVMEAMAQFIFKEIRIGVGNVMKEIQFGSE